MEEDILYKQAVTEVRELVEQVLEQCNDFANDYCYEREWVLDRFQEEFTKAKRKVTIK